MTHIACPNEGETDEEAMARWNAMIPGMISGNASGVSEQADRQVVQRGGLERSEGDDRSRL
ncbi:MAG: hypothetical protein NVSMB52_21120 [Chloroflexota bacterium]